MSKLFRWYGVALLVTGISACEQEPLAVVTAEPATILASAAETQGAALAEIRAATARYHDIEAALADGYVEDTPCIFNAAAGGRGFIYPNRSRFDGVFDPTQPELLFYEPMKNGQLRLVGVGFVVVSAPWDAVNSGPPMLGNQAFIDRRTPPFGPPFPNYALFAWVWKHNPSGMYEQYNPQVSCEFTEDIEER